MDIFFNEIYNDKNVLYKSSTKLCTKSTRSANKRIQVLDDTLERIFLWKERL